MTRAAANDLAGTSGAQSGSCFGLSADNQPPPVANHFLKAASNLVSAAPANVTVLWQGVRQSAFGARLCATA